MFFHRSILHNKFTAGQFLKIFWLILLTTLAFQERIPPRTAAVLRLVILASAKSSLFLYIHTFINATLFQLTRNIFARIYQLVYFSVSCLPLNPVARTWVQLVLRDRIVMSYKCWRAEFCIHFHLGWWNNSSHPKLRFRMDICAFSQLFCLQVRFPKLVMLKF